MDEICGLFVICTYITIFFIEIHPCAKEVNFITEFVLLIKNPPFYEVNSFNRKWLAHGGIQKIFCVMDVHIINKL